MADGKYYWLKLKKDFFKRHDIRIIESMPNGKDYILFYLKLLCESIDHAGNLRFSESIPYNESMLATITFTNIDVVKSAIDVFTKLGMMEIMDDGTYYMSEVAKITGSESEWAEKKRIYRQSQKKLTSRGQNEDNVLPSEDNVRGQKDKVRQEIDIEKDIEIEREKEPDKKRARASADQIAKEFSLSDPVRDAFDRYLSYLSEIGKPAGIETERAILKKLNGLARSEAEAVEILDNAIRKQWKDIYHIDKGTKQKKSAVGSFGNYEQRDFDYSELEKKMRGYGDG